MVGGQVLAVAGHVRVALGQPAQGDDPAEGGFPLRRSSGSGMPWPRRGDC